jgi:DHA1 family bicyclomycin/chloramphenicol resistance-like MFS transporter
VTASSASLPFTLLLGILIGLAALGMDAFLPAVPAIAQAFGAEPGAAQHAVTTYLLGLALGQFAWGPLSDRYGRKPVLLAGIVLAVASSLACTQAGSVQAIVLLRFVQGVGLSSGPVVARSVVRDLYAREQAAHLLSRMTVVFGIFPFAGPLIGAQLLGWQGWQAVFWMYAATSVALLIAVSRGLAETAPVERPSISARRIAAGFAALLRDRRFLAPIAVMLPAQLGIIAFVSASALVLVQAFQLTPTTFSFLFAAVMLGQVGGGYAASRLVSRVGIARMVRLGAALACAFGLLLAALALAGATHWGAVVGPMIGYIFGCAFIIPNATAAALSPFPRMAGAASSLLGTLPFALGALVSALLAFAFDGSARPMAIAIALGGAAAALGERLLFAFLPGERAAHG